MQDLLLREAKREAAAAARNARKASEESARIAAGAGGRSFAAPGAAERTAELVEASAGAAERAAFLLDLRLKLAESTSTYRPWQQIPAWVLGAAGIGLSFVLAFDDGAAVAGWVVTALMLALSVIMSFRGPADLTLGTGSNDHGDEGDDKDKDEQSGDTGGGDSAGGKAGGPTERADAPTGEEKSSGPPQAPSRHEGSDEPTIRVPTPAIAPPVSGLRYFATGLDYRTRRPLARPLAAEELVNRLHQRLAANADEVRRVTEHTHFATRVRGERERVALPDLGDPRAARWTYLVAEGDPDLDEIMAAVRPLAEHRGMQQPDSPLLYRTDISWGEWLTDHYQSIDPNERPYYVMVVGGPERVPFHFQALLDSAAAVGRVAFDSLDDLRAYVEKVLRVEKAREAVAQPSALFFAPDGGAEDATFFSRRYLAEPLSRVAAEADVDVRLLAGDEATKSNLVEALAGQRFALVYTASHGVGAPNEPLDVQRQLNGAICCQATEEDWLFAAEDVPIGEDAFLDGSVFFQFACYGYGTPAESDFMHWLGEPTFNSTADFVASLPKRLLARSRGPVAFIGHVDTAWLHGFDDPDNPLIVDPYHERLQAFATAVSSLLTIQPVGLALTELNKRFDLLNGVLAGELDRMARRSSGLTPEIVTRLANTFVFRSDAQNYAVFGDPATSVRLP